MSARCPHLGLAGNRKEIFLLANARHRCYVRGQPERVGSSFQAGTCLTSAYRRCPRLMAVAMVPSAADRAPGQDLLLQPAQRADLIPGARTADWPDVELAEAQKAVLYPDLQAIEPHMRRRGRGRMSLTEFIVMGLGLSIVMAVLFVGYVLFHRLLVGPGMEAKPPVASASTVTPVDARPTLVPTFAPAPAPTRIPTVPSAMPEPLPPITEPTLSPAPTPYARPPAMSPPTRLTIASIDLDIPVSPVGVKTVVEGGTEKQVWADVPNAGGFHATSAYPGKPGNTVINGHRDMLGAVFRDLNHIQVGDEIVLYVGEVAYPYYVTEILIVPETFASARQRAENQRLIGYMPEERLTLVTCTPIGLATHRLLVIAKPPEQAFPSAPEIGTESGL